jgi:hypothetical protein
MWQNFNTSQRILLAMWMEYSSHVARKISHAKKNFFPYGKNINFVFPIQ